jgi:hypothetical protein
MSLAIHWLYAVNTRKLANVGIAGTIQIHSRSQPLISRKPSAAQARTEDAAP